MGDPPLCKFAGAILEASYTLTHGFLDNTLEHQSSRLESRSYPAVKIRATLVLSRDASNELTRLFPHFPRPLFALVTPYSSYFP